MVLQPVVIIVPGATCTWLPETNGYRPGCWQRIIKITRRCYGCILFVRTYTAPTYTAGNQSDGPVTGSRPPPRDYSIPFDIFVFHQSTRSTSSEGRFSVHPTRTFTVPRPRLIPPEKNNHVERPKHGNTNQLNSYYRRRWIKRYHVQMEDTLTIPTQNADAPKNGRWPTYQYVRWNPTYSRKRACCTETEVALSVFRGLIRKKNPTRDGCSLWKIRDRQPGENGFFRCHQVGITKSTEISLKKPFPQKNIYRLSRLWTL